MSICQVQLSRLAQKQITKLPQYIVRKLMLWVGSVESVGIEQVRRLPGYHDEPLQGKRLGQRSIRLSQSYRAIYHMIKKTQILIEVLEVNKHDY